MFLSFRRDGQFEAWRHRLNLEKNGLRTNISQPDGVKLTLLIFNRVKLRFKTRILKNILNIYKRDFNASRCFIWRTDLRTQHRHDIIFAAGC